MGTIELRRRAMQLKTGWCNFRNCLQQVFRSTQRGTLDEKEVDFIIILIFVGLYIRVATAAQSLYLGIPGLTHLLVDIATYLNCAKQAYVVVALLLLLLAVLLSQVMNRTVKVTGFSLKPAIRRQLFRLFTRVGQVQKVILSPDRNSAFVRLEYKSAVEFVLGQKWTLGNDSLRVRPCVIKSPSPIRSGIASHQSLSKLPHPADSHITSGTTYDDYTKSRNQIWVDFPHDKYGMLPSKKKRKRHFTDDCKNNLVSIGNHTKKRRANITKKKQKKKHVCLESFPSIPFGVTPVTKAESAESFPSIPFGVAPVGTAETAESFPSIPFGVAPVGTAETADTREVYIKGTDTKRLVLPRSSTAGGLRSLVSEATGVPADLLYVTVGGRSLTDEVVADIEEGSTVHYSVKGVGGSDKESSGDAAQQLKKTTEDLKTQGNEMYSKKLYEAAAALYTASIAAFPLTAAYNNRAQCFIRERREPPGAGKESNRQRTMEDIDGGQHPAVDGQSLGRKVTAKAETYVLIFSQISQLTWMKSDIFIGKWEECISDCNYILQKEPKNVKALLRRGRALKEKGDMQLAQKDLHAVCSAGSEHLVQTAKDTLHEIEVELSKKETDPSLRMTGGEQGSGEKSSSSLPQLSKSAGKKQRKKALKTTGEGSARELLQEKDSITPEKPSGSGSQPSAADSSVRTDDGADQGLNADSDTTTPVCSRALPQDADEAAVKEWLNQVCRIPSDKLPQFRGMDAKTLYSYTEFESLLLDVKISYGKARKILYLLKFPDCKSDLQNWTTSDVQGFIREKLGDPDLDLMSFSKKEVDGVVFLSFTDGGELKRDLGLNGITARRIYEERNMYIKDEKTKVFKTERAKLQHEASSNPSDENNEVSTSHVGGLFHASQSDVPNIVVSNEADAAAFHKLFLQDTLHLQALHLREECPEKLIQSSLKILRIKEKNPSKLDKSFLFFILCRPDFKKSDLPSLWKLIKGQTHDLWKGMYEQKLNMGKLKVQGKGLLMDGVEQAFSKIPTPSFVSFMEFESCYGMGYMDYPIHVLLVDQQLTNGKESVSGYSCKLGNKKDSAEYHFGFESDRSYQCFDSKNWGSRIKECRIQNARIGSAPRCQLQLSTVTGDEVEGSPGSQLFDKEQPDVSADDTNNSSGVAFALSESGPVSHPQLDRQSCGESELPTRCAHPRHFRDDPKIKVCKYDEGCILDVLESANDMINPSIELKFYDVEKEESKPVFLLKSFKFICGCLNSRKNGTIYFGVPEGAVRDKHFQYGEVVGVSLAGKREQEHYTEVFYKYLDKCFGDRHELVKSCVYGPFFVRVKTVDNRKEKYVIEVDVEPLTDMCDDCYFTLNPVSIDSTLKQQCDVYVRDTGNQDGTVQTRRLNDKQRADFIAENLPGIVAKRRREDDRKIPRSVNIEVSRFKRFMEKCDESVDPILVISKPTDTVKQDVVNCLKFVNFISWTAVFDFDPDSVENGLFKSYTNHTFNKQAAGIKIKDFTARVVEGSRDKPNLSTQTLWILGNGCTESEDFKHLHGKEWFKNYYPYIKDAVSFLQNHSVISKQRHHVIVLVSGEYGDDIVRTADDIASSSNIDFENIFFVFDHEHTAAAFLDKSSHADDVRERMAVLPWQDVQSLVMEVLKLGKKDEHKKVMTANNTPAQIPPRQWREKWTDLSILSANECEDMDLDPQCRDAIEEEKHFYRGGQVSWYNFHLNNHIMERTIMQKIDDEIMKLSQVTVAADSHVPKLMIYHMPGTGGTTLARHLLWKRRNTFKCAIITKLTQETYDQICELWEAGESDPDQMKWKPVLLVSDNNTTAEGNETESSLCNRLFRHQKRDRLPRPVAIIIICNRSFHHRIDGYSLQQKIMDERERRELEKIHNALGGKFGIGKQKNEINTFLGFISMRHGFDKEKLQQIIIPYLDSQILTERERCIIVYIALIMSYFPVTLGHPGIPVRSFDRFLQDTGPWERNLSEVARNILIREKNWSIGTTVVRVANTVVAEMILKRAREKNVQRLAQFVIDLLNSNLVDCPQWDTDDNALHDTLTVKIIRSMLIERQTEFGTKTEMSQLILDVKDESGLEGAQEVLELGYEQLGGAVFYQQLARLFKAEQQFEKAIDNARNAISLSPTSNADFLHTLGNVYLCYFEHLKSIPNNASRGIGDHFFEISIAIESFKILTEAQQDEDAVTRSYACCDKIKVINALLYYIRDNVLQPRQYYDFGFFLVGERATMRENVFEGYPDIEEKIRILLQAGLEALKYMYYFGFSYEHGGRWAQARKVQAMRDQKEKKKDKTKSPVAYTKSQSIKQFKILAKEISCVLPNRSKGTDVPAYWYRIYNLTKTGSFFESILNFVTTFHHCQKRIGITQHRCRARLEEIKANLDSISENDLTTEDMDSYITVCLAMELLKIEPHFSQIRERLYVFCRRIIVRRDDEVRTMRAHLYRVLICWPAKSKGHIYSASEFCDSFHNRPSWLTSRDGPLHPRVHFFVAKQSETVALCHWTEIFERKKKTTGHEDDLEQDSEDDGEVEDKVTVTMHQKLEPFEGIYRESNQQGRHQHASIEFRFPPHYRDRVDVGNLTVRHFKGEKVYANSTVKFFLGFSVHGPVAYIYHSDSSASSTVQKACSERDKWCASGIAKK